MMSSADELFYGSPEPALMWARGGQRDNRGQSKDAQVVSQSRPRSLSTVELRVPMCCMKCEEKVKEVVLDMDDVATVYCDQWNQKVIVTGNVDPLRLLKKVKRIKKTSEIWSRSTPPQCKKETKAASQRSAISHGGEYVLSYDQFLPSYNESIFYDPYALTSYNRMHNNSVITNPDYFKHVRYY